MLEWMFEQNENIARKDAHPNYSILLMRNRERTRSMWDHPLPLCRAARSPVQLRKVVGWLAAPGPPRGLASSSSLVSMAPSTSGTWRTAHTNLPSRSKSRPHLLLLSFRSKSPVCSSITLYSFMLHIFSVGSILWLKILWLTFWHFRGWFFLLFWRLVFLFSSFHFVFFLYK